jgi:peptide/nickel transport system substrate-binding protein
MRLHTRGFALGFAPGFPVGLAVGFALGLAMALAASGTALAQKSGGTLHVYNTSNPPSASILEEVTIATVMPFMAVFNNLVLIDQHRPRNSLEGIVPELAESWAWDGSGTKLTFKLRQGVKWHDGKPFTAKDVRCTWHRLLGKEDDFRKNPRRVWYANLEDVTVDDDYQATFHLSKPQPALIMLLGSGMAPVYPCHVPAKDMRTHPIGTGPFKFVEFKANDTIRLVRNSDYWRPGRPYLDAIDWRIIPNRATRVLAFIAGEFDLTFVGDVTVPISKQLAAQAPQARCKLVPTNVTTNLIVNRDIPPFNDPNIRRAMMLGLDRQGYQHPHRGQSLDLGSDDAAPQRQLGNAGRHAWVTARLRGRAWRAPGRGTRDHGARRLRPQQPPQG